MAKIVRKTLREQVTDVIRLRILRGEIQPGERIVEQEMAETLGVSRGPVREALRQIEQEGLVEYVSHVGCSVKEFTDRDIYEIYLLRADLEILSVKLCEGKFSPETIAQLEKICQEMDQVQDVEYFDETIQNDNDFHACIVQESGLDRLYQLWSSLTPCNTIVFYTRPGPTEFAVHNQRRIHQRVVDAIKTGDQTVICQALLDHYMETVRGKVKFPKDSVQRLSNQAEAIL